MEDFQGKGSANRYDKSKQCRKCNKTGFVRYVGSGVTHGNIYTPAADTEVGFYYECTNCGHEWTEYV